MKAIVLFVLGVTLFGAVSGLNIVHNRRRADPPVTSTAATPAPVRRPPPPNPNDDLRFDVFNNPTSNSRGVKLAPIATGDPRFAQRAGYDANNLIYCETSASIGTSVDKLVALIQGKWTWWLGGRQLNRVVKPTGTDYVLFPAFLGVKVHEFMHLPEKMGTGYIIRIDFLPDGNSFASGRGYFLVMPDGNTGRTRLIGRFAAVKSRILPAKFFTETHLKGERGQLFGGLLKAGWYHLIEIAEGRETLPADYKLFTLPPKTDVSKP